MQKKISIKDISEQADVSIATVSRVINKNGRYSKETEERVLRVIRENNYQPNLIA
ncbi:MAG: LacI family DNA-binding transcriptional regulator, partial [Clostridia bacterium]|nr:LacI family DNA-binding transcriptional regulator [Clostridia bacterium]